jgi:hypothetical protein
VAYTAGQKIRASYFNIPIVTSSDSTITSGTTTSVSYTNTTTQGIRGVSFTAPASGSVVIFYAALTFHGTLSKSLALDCEVRTGSTVGSGTLIRPSSDITAGIMQNAAAGQNLHCSGFAPVTGLTAGVVYNAAMTYKLIDAGTGTYYCRNLVVQPV